MERLDYNIPIVLVEGIFDSIVVRALGLVGIAAMGITMSLVKQKLLYSFARRVIAIPDNDTEGQKVVRYDRWGLPLCGSYLQWKGNYNNLDIKDIDLLYRVYDPQSLQELFQDLFKARNKKIIRISL